MPISWLVAARAGLGQGDLRVTALEGNAMWAAFQSKQIDGMSNSPPWPLKPVVDGLSVVIASGPDGDPPNAINFAYDVVVAEAGDLREAPADLRRDGPWWKEAIAYMHSHKAEVVALLGRKFSNLEPKLIAAAYDEIIKSTPKVPVVTQAVAGERRRLQRRSRHDEGRRQAQKLRRALHR